MADHAKQVSLTLPLPRFNLRPALTRDRADSRVLPSRTQRQRNGAYLPRQRKRHQVLRPARHATRLPHELVIPAWDHLAIGEPQAEPKHEDFASTAPETNNDSPGTPRRPVPALKNSANPHSAADPKGPRSITELQDLRNIYDYGSST